MAEEATTTEPEKAAEKKPGKHKLPEGWMTPVAATHALKEGGHAPDKLNSAQLYILSRAAASNGMPVKHFDADGNMYDTLQTDADGKTTTRPGVHWDGNDDAGSFREWWIARPARAAAKKEAAAANKKPAKDAKDAEADNDDEAADLTGDEEIQLADDEADLVEAE